MAGDLEIERGKEQDEGPFAHPTMVRLEIHTVGIAPTSGKWEFLEEAIETVIENYGGEVVELERFPQPSSRVDQVMNQSNR